MTCLIIDDEQPARQRLRRLINPIDILEIEGEAADAEEALVMVKENQPDLVFLDISMPNMSGIQLANLLLEKYPKIKIIFTTAYDEYALEAFDVNAIDYLLKPIRRERLFKAVKKLLPEQENEAFYVLKDGNKTLKIAIDEIILLHSDNKYTEVHLMEKTLLSADSLKVFEENYPQKFLRIHRSTLINPKYLKSLEQQQQQMTVTLVSSDITPEVSRRHQAEIKKYLHR